MAAALCACIRDWKRLRILWPMWNKRSDDLPLISTDDTDQKPHHGDSEQSKILPRIKRINADRRDCPNRRNCQSSPELKIQTCTSLSYGLDGESCSFPISAHRCKSAVSFCFLDPCKMKLSWNTKVTTLTCW